MEFTENFKAAVDGIAANKMRSLLSILGIIIGIVAVITIVSITQGAQQSISEKIQALGTNLIIVFPGRKGGAAGSKTKGLSRKEFMSVFTVEEGEKIRRRASAVKLVVPTLQRNFLLQY
ncbi:MAG: ABC transporter permease, partial [Candidatus Aerophobetes bacterium]|nr:ABC transporter permease [Candidatus Aerophobetes bacterium]